MSDGSSRGTSPPLSQAPDSDEDGDAFSSALIQHAANRLGVKYVPSTGILKMSSDRFREDDSMKRKNEILMKDLMREYTDVSMEEVTHASEHEAVDLRHKIDVRVKALGRNHASLVDLYMQLSCCHLNTAQRREVRFSIAESVGDSDIQSAERFMLEALHVSESNCHPDSPGLLPTLSQLALFYSRTRQFSKAESVFSRCAQISRIAASKTDTVESNRKLFGSDESQQLTGKQSIATDHLQSIIGEYRASMTNPLYIGGDKISTSTVANALATTYCEKTSKPNLCTEEAMQDNVASEEPETTNISRSVLLRDEERQLLKAPALFSPKELVRELQPATVNKKVSSRRIPASLEEALSRANRLRDERRQRERSAEESLIGVGSERSPPRVESEVARLLLHQ